MKWVYLYSLGEKIKVRACVSVCSCCWKLRVWGYCKQWITYLYPQIITVFLGVTHYKHCICIHTHIHTQNIIKNTKSNCSEISIYPTHTCISVVTSVDMTEGGLGLGFLESSWISVDASWITESSRCGSLEREPSAVICFMCKCFLPKWTSLNLYWI